MTERGGVRGAMQGGARAANRARTLAAIRGAALDLFESDGFDETTVERIAARAGVSLRTFFRYFPAKEALLFGTDLQASTLALIRSRPAGEPLLASLDAASEAFAASGPTPDDERRRRLRRRLVVDHPSVRAHGRKVLMDLEPTLVELAAERLEVDPSVDLRPQAFAGLWTAMVAAIWEGRLGGEDSADQGGRWLAAAASLLGPLPTEG